MQPKEKENTMENTLKITIEQFLNAKGEGDKAKSLGAEIAEQVKQAVVSNDTETLAYIESMPEQKEVYKKVKSYVSKGRKVAKYIALGIISPSDSRTVSTLCNEIAKIEKANEEAQKALAVRGIERMQAMVTVFGSVTDYDNAMNDPSITEAEKAALEVKIQNAIRETKENEAVAKAKAHISALTSQAYDVLNELQESDFEAFRKIILDFAGIEDTEQNAA